MKKLLRVALRMVLALPAWVACAYALWVAVVMLNYAAVVLGLSQDPASPVVLVIVVTLLSAGSAVAFLMLALSVITGRPLLPLPRMRRLWARVVVLSMLTMEP